MSLNNNFHIQSILKSEMMTYFDWTVASETHLGFTVNL